MTGIGIDYDPDILQAAAEIEKSSAFRKVIEAIADAQCELSLSEMRDNVRNGRFNEATQAEAQATAWQNLPHVFTGLAGRYHASRPKQSE